MPEQPLLDVAEVFASLQGEGQQTGRPFIFVRLAGCNRSCSFCDTRHAVALSLTQEELLLVIDDLPATRKFRDILWTGGEPLMQLRASQLDFFWRKGFTNTLETNGDFLETLHRLRPYFDYVSVSPKGQLSMDRLDKLMQYANEIRIAADASVLEQIASFWHIPNAPVRLYVSPIDPGANQEYQRNLRDCINFCTIKTPWRVSCQLHKRLWNID